MSPSKTTFPGATDGGALGRRPAPDRHHVGLSRIARAGCVAAVALLTACARGDASPAGAVPRAIPVDLARIDVRELAPPVIATGSLGGKDEVALAFTIGGIVSRILVDEGSPVRQGQLLAELSPVEINAEVAKAQQGRDKAQRDLARVRTLHVDSVATTEQLQDAATALDVAEQNLRIARFNLEHAVIRASANGVVLRRSAEPSQVIAPGTPVLTVRLTGRGVVLRAGLADRDAVRVRLGDEASVTFDALPADRFTARVTQLASAASAATGTYDVELTLEPRAGSLASGLIGRAEIRTRAQGRFPVVPIEALVEADGDSATLFVVPDGTERGVRRQVRIGRILGDVAALSSGAEVGEWVVVRGAAYLDESSRLVVNRGNGATGAAR